MIFVVVFLFGLIVGSFLNVCIVRLPREQSIVSPRSQCPRCRTPIRWYDNIPLVSFITLRGKCRSCGLPISWRYPLVELLNGLLYLWAYAAFGMTGEAGLVMALCSALLVITFIDLDHQIIPDVITLPGMVIGLLAAPLFMSALEPPMAFGLGKLLPSAGTYLTGFVNSLVGLVLGAAPLFIIGWLWEKFRKVEAMGGGDVKYMGMVGCFLGWKGAFLTIMLGALTGSLVGMTLIALKKHQADKVIPFGPYLAFGTLLTLFYGADIISWYFGFFRS
ncbi:MAG: Prepilin peptidase [Nitrospirae bacterium]|nr:Prepilin peptidase [Nitrospirota bacterium]MBS1128000.1 Prepilin peptidase [Nitrospirota bacterium]